jgi:hypothetical protein
MCGGDMPETRMEKLLFAITEDSVPQCLMDENGKFLSCSASELARELGTTPQVIGKVMSCQDFWQRIVRHGKVVYVPVEEVK